MAPRIVYVERLSDGVVVAFDDGRCALYSSRLLYETFHDAEPIDDSDSMEQ